MSGKYIKFWRGTTDLFNKTVKDNDTIYFVTDNNKSLYLGNNIISNYIQNALTSAGGNMSGDLNFNNGASISLDDDIASYITFKINNIEKGKFYYNNLGKEFTINNITAESSLLLKDDKSLVYKIGNVEHVLINNTGVIVPSINKVFNSTNSGFVPAPGTANVNKFLKGNGTWSDIVITNGVTKTGSFTAGQVVKVNNATGVIESSGYTIAKSVPSNAVFTDTWRPVQDNLSSDSSTDSLSAKQGKALKTLIDSKPSTSYVDNKVAELVNSAPETLDTLNELAAALGNDPNFATTVSSQIGTKLDKSTYTATDVLAKIKTVDGAGSGLDADLLDGKSSAEFAPSSHTHSNYTNQNAFSNVKVGATTITADTTTDTLELVAGSNITLSPDATNDKVTISAANTWRPIVDNLTSDSTTDALSAKQGKVLKGLVDGKLGKSEKAADTVLFDGKNSSSYSRFIAGATHLDTVSDVSNLGLFSSNYQPAGTTLPGGNFISGMMVRHQTGTSEKYANQLVFVAGSENPFIRSSNSTGVFAPWRKLWHEGNFDPNSKLNAATYTAADVLAKIKTVDGSGSGLDADLLDGKSSAEFASASHSHSNYTNQNAFSNVKVGATTIAADAITDTLELVAGSNITLTPDATNDKVTIIANNTWRGIVDNLTSDSTTDSLSAKQGKVLKGLVDGKLGKTEKAADSAKLNGIDSSRVIYGVDARGTTPEDKDTNTILKSGFYASSGGTLNTSLAGGACAIIHTQWDGQDLAGFQISESIEKTELSHRSKNGGAWSTWRKILDSNNTKLSGNTVTINGVAATFNNYTHPGYTQRATGFYKFSVDTLGHVNGVTAVTKADITALGIPGSDTNTWRPVIDNLTSSATADSLSANQGRVLKGLVDGKLGKSEKAADSSWADTSRKVVGTYTGNGGKFIPSYVGRGRVCFNMSNEDVRGNTGYKDWIIMDTYSADDAGGATAFGVYRSGLGAYIMQSDAARTTWNRKAELWGSHNFDPATKLNSSAYTAADVLAKIKTVDGAGSGLDADLLDGKSSGDFCLTTDSRLSNSRPASDVYAWAKASVKPSYNMSEIRDAPSSGVAANTVFRRIMNGSVINSVGYNTRVCIGYKRGTSNWGEGLFSVGTNDAGTTYQDFRFNVNGRIYSSAGTFVLPGDNIGTGATNYAAGNHSHSNYSPTSHTHSNYLPTSSYTAADVLAKIKSVDGSGSGLDADLLDGKNSSEFAPASHSHSYASISSDLGNTNLNNVNGYGIYCNPANAQATPANNYPLNEAGTLFFGNAAYGSSNQIYGTFAANRWFARGGGNNSASKTGWKEFCFIGNNIGTGATNYAAGNHTHSNYSLTSHTHSNYLPTSGGTISGSLTVTGNISQTSSRKFKENIINFEDNALDIIVNTKIVNYNYINDDKKMNHVGFIAEDTSEILSTKDKNTMDLGSCVGVLMKSVQELNDIIKEQQNTINDLKNQIKGLSNK